MGNYVSLDGKDSLMIIDYNYDGTYTLSNGTRISEKLVKKIEKKK